ncbi:hypothetical protein D1007_22428 [Hordeum vulgare]|nr:hypothetical protein D1007_22428 [Hordeum vulgare]
MSASSVSSATISLDVESEDDRSTVATVVAGDGSSRNLLERAYPQEVWRHEEKCTLVLQSSMKFKCCHRWIKFHRWFRDIRATPAGLEYKTKLSFEGLPDQAWLMKSIKGVLKDLGDDLIEMIPPNNRRELEVMAWLRDPSKVAKVLDVEIPEPKLALCTDPPPESLEELVAREEASSYGSSSSKKKKKTLVYPVICHLKEVIDRGPLLTEDLPDEWLPNEGEDLTRLHKLRHHTSRPRRRRRRR